MAGHERRGETVTQAQTHKEVEPIHILFMRNHGKVRSMSISTRLLLFTCVFALIFVAASVFAINRSIVLTLENRTLNEKVKTMENALSDYQFQSQVLSRYNELVNELNQTGETANSVENGNSKVGDGAGTTVSNGETEKNNEGSTATDSSTGNQKTDPEKQAASAGNDLVSPENPPVDAVKLSLRPANNTVRFQYSLVNTERGNKAVSGYLFIVLANTSSGSAKFVPYPEVELENGVPADLKKGMQFSIRHGKTVRGSIANVENPADYDQAWIYAFSYQGDLLLKKLLAENND